MKRYYMELKDNKPIIHVVEESDRHKIWRDYPKAKEISKSMYLDLMQAIDTHNKKVTQHEPKKDNGERPCENGHKTERKVQLRKWKSALLGAWLRVQQAFRLPFNGNNN